MAGARLQRCTNKAGMSFNFIGMMLATTQSIKDSRLRRVDGGGGVAFPEGRTLRSSGALVSSPGDQGWSAALS